MRARQVHAGRLELVERPDPEPAADELLVRVLACGVCRTDLHVLDGDLPSHRTDVTPGHEAVGVVVGAGVAVTGFPTGGRVGVAWLRRTCGRCDACRSGRENLCPQSEYTGWDADGGYAELVTVRAAYAYPRPDDLDPATNAPLLCAGIIGFRALRRAEVPAGGRLGLDGFGGSAQLSDVPPLDHQRHLFHEKQVRSVEANTREDGRELLATAARIGLRVTTRPYAFAHADRALDDLRADHVNGAAVLVLE